MDWQQLILFAILGLGAGSLIAGVALGIVVSYRGSGIINLATGAIAMLAGYSYWSLRTGSYGVDVPTAPALVITALFLLGVGLLIEFGRLPTRCEPQRRSRSSRPRSGCCSSPRRPSRSRSGSGRSRSRRSCRAGPSRSSARTCRSTGSSCPGIVLTATLVLSLVYRLSRFGVSTRAASENEVAAMLLGLSPNRLALTSTLLATFVAGGARRPRGLDHAARPAGAAAAWSSRR